MPFKLKALNPRLEVKNKKKTLDRNIQVVLIEYHHHKKKKKKNA